MVEQENREAIMEKWILAVILGWGLVLIANPALATCRTYTISTPDGRIVFCQECCWANGNCTVSCN